VASVLCCMVWRVVLARCCTPAISTTRMKLATTRYSLAVTAASDGRIASKPEAKGHLT
jgi:hypothetical protein